MIYTQEQKELYSQMAQIFINEPKTTMKELSDQNNVPYHSFYYYMQKNGLAKRKDIRKPRKATEESIQKIVNEYLSDETMSLKKLAKKYGVHYTTVSSWLNRKGIKKHRVKYIDQEKINQALVFYNNGNNSMNAAKKANIGRNSFRKYLKKNNLLKKEVIIQKDKTYDRNFFEKLDTEEKAYWFGFVYADGCVSYDTTHTGALCIEISKKDKSHLLKLLQSMNSNAKIKYRMRTWRNGHTSEMCSIAFNSAKIAKDLIQKGCIPNKTYDGKIKKGIFKTNALKVAFLRGYIDGDGFISKNAHTYCTSIVVHNHNIMNYLLRMIIELTEVIPIVKWEEDKFGGAYRLRIQNKKDFFKYLDIIYKDAHIYMDRKYNNYLLHLPFRDKLAEVSE